MKRLENQFSGRVLLRYARTDEMVACSPRSLRQPRSQEQRHSQCEGGQVVLTRLSSPL